MTQRLNVSGAGDQPCLSTVGFYLLDGQFLRHVARQLGSEGLHVRQPQLPALGRKDS